MRPPYESQHHAVEIKRSLSDPRPSKGFHLACDELEVRGCRGCLPGAGPLSAGRSYQGNPFHRGGAPGFSMGTRVTLIASTRGSPSMVKRASNTTPHTGGDSRFRTFVLFRHKPHLDAKFKCEDCHGQVRSREVLARDKDFTMKTCIACHMEGRRARPLEMACGTVSPPSAHSRNRWPWHLGDGCKPWTLRRAYWATCFCLSTFNRKLASNLFRGVRASWRPGNLISSRWANRKEKAADRSRTLARSRLFLLDGEDFFQFSDRFFFFSQSPISGAESLMRVYEIRLQSNGGSEVVKGDVVLFLNERDFPREGLGMSVARVHPQGLPDGILRRGDVLGDV